MKKLTSSYNQNLLCTYPERIIQFGEGNFLRGFIDWMIHKMNQQGLFQGRIVAIQPTPHGRVVGKLNAQNGLYTVVLRGIQNGNHVDNREIITAVSRGINPYEDWQECLRCAENPQIEYVFSNTTEAGLIYRNEDTADMEPPLSYPGKLTLYLYHRYRHFNGAADKGMWLLPCELLENNGDILKSIILKYCESWDLPEGFRLWIENCNKFVNTLVDRVVSGYPNDEIDTFTQELGYDDALLVCGEPFHFLALEGGNELATQLPFTQAGLNVVIAEDISPYRLRKVRILNGAHTACVPAAFLTGLQTVSEMMHNETSSAFMYRIVEKEIVPSISLAPEMLNNFAHDVGERFANPFIKHQLSSILLNSSAKFKARVLPSLLQYQVKFGCLPLCITFSFAAYIALYRNADPASGKMYIKNHDGCSEIQDDITALRILADAWALYDNTKQGAVNTVTAVLQSTVLWDKDLTTITGLVDNVSNFLYSLEIEGAAAIMKRLCKE